MLIKRNFFLVVTLLTLSLAVILKISIRDTNGVSERSEINAKIIDEVARCKDDLSLIKEIIYAHDKDHFSNLPHHDDNTILIYKNKQLFFWSDNKVIPDHDVLTGDYSHREIELRNGKFIAVQSTFAKEGNKGNEKDIYNAYILIPLSYKYDIENKYISSGINKKLFPDDPTDQLFGVILLLLVSIALLSFLIYTYLAAQKIALKWNVEAGFFLLLLIIAIIRVLLLYYTFPFSFYEINLFNPKYYASSILSPSFGDLLINILCVYYLLLFVFKNYRRSILLKLLDSLSPKPSLNPPEGRREERGIKGGLGVREGKLVGLTVIIIILSHSTLLGVFLILKSIYFHSQWTIDITSDINFSFYKIICLIIFVLICGIYFLINHILSKAFIRIYCNHKFFASSVFVLITILYGMFLSQFSELNDWVVIILNCVYFAVLVACNIPQFLTRLNYSTYLYLFFAAIVCAVTGSYSLYNFNVKKNVIDKQRFATQLLYENDVFGEFLLEETAKQIKKDVFIQNRLISPFSSKGIIEQKIKRAYLNNYFDKYDTKIYILNARGDLFSYSSILHASGSQSQVKPTHSDPEIDTKFQLDEKDTSEIQEDSTCYYKKLLNRYKKTEYRTEYPDLFFINDISEHGKNSEYSGGHFASSLKNRYIKFIEIKKGGIDIGKIVIDLKLKKIIPNSVIPELLLDERFVQLHFSKQYSYAVFAGNNMIYSFGDYNYKKDIIESIFNFNDIYDLGIKLKGFHHLLIGSEHTRLSKYDPFYVKNEGHRHVGPGLPGRSPDSFKVNPLQQADKHIIITSSIYPFQNIFSNFSFLFLLLTFSILLFVLIYAGIERYRKKDIKTNYSTKIQIFLNVAFFLPLIIVSITTLSLINSSYKKDIKKRYLKNAERASINLAASFEKYKRGRLNKESLTNQLLQVAKYSESDINLFDINGRLIISSQPLIFEEGLLSKLINPTAYAEIVEKKNRRILLSESIGSLKYNAVYAEVKSFDSALMLGILSIPFFDSKSELDRQLIDVITMIINIFTGVFILFVLFSYFASQKLIYPLKLITQKIKKTTLGAENEPLEWASNDEIGFLISEYNLMLVKLKESKEALALSEKQSAWREMAKQVAHEIKNPLTPMKLTLQHLKYAIKESSSSSGSKSNKLNIKELTEKTINTLVNQIETLNDITNSFSLFANMPVPKNEKIDIGKVLKRTIDLFNNSTPTSKIRNPKFEIRNPKSEIRNSKSEIQYPVYVMADEQLMNRIFTNLLLNAVESVPKTRKPEILARLSTTHPSPLTSHHSPLTTHPSVIIEIKDNGTGIEEEIKDKIFISSFSTKLKGTGIGLAIAKRGVELTGGNIWFETEIGVGTSFFIKLALLDT